MHVSCLWLLDAQHRGWNLPSCGPGPLHEPGIFPSPSTGYSVWLPKAHAIPEWLCLGQRQLPKDHARFRAAIK